MSEPIALYVRYAGNSDPIRQKILEEQDKSPTKSLRSIVEGWIIENEQLKQELITQQKILEKLDLLIDIHNSYIVDKNYHAVYPTSLKTSDMIRALEDSRFRLNVNEEI